MRDWKSSGSSLIWAQFSRTGSFIFENVTITILSLLFLLSLRRLRTVVVSSALSQGITCERAEKRGEINIGTFHVFKKIKLYLTWYALERPLTSQPSSLTDSESSSYLRWFNSSLDRYSRIIWNFVTCHRNCMSKFTLPNIKLCNFSHEIYR